MTALVQTGSGTDIIAAMTIAQRAIVFISVPWSGPERHARQIFASASSQLAERQPELNINYFRLEADEDAASHQWLYDADHISSL